MAGQRRREHATWGVGASITVLREEARFLSSGLKRVQVDMETEVRTFHCYQLVLEFVFLHFLRLRLNHIDWRALVPPCAQYCIQNAVAGLRTRF